LQLADRQGVVDDEHAGAPPCRSFSIGSNTPHGGRGRAGLAGSFDQARRVEHDQDRAIRVDAGPGDDVEAR
jgi:hypothetical protein